ncbi:MAG: type II toxin-antitoxin system HipA family toxin [Fibrobacterota bacterium]
MNKLNVHIDFGDSTHKVGTLFLSENLGRHAFAFDRDFIGTGLEISPWLMPLGSATYTAERNSDLYDLHGVFADSLPDAWGRKVQDAEFQKIGLHDVTALHRLAFVGRHGIGALRYEPAQEFEQGQEAIRLADCRKAAQRIIAGHPEEVTDELLRCGGSAGGARPKFLVDLNLKNPDEIRYTRGQQEGGFVPVILKVPVRGGDHFQRIEYVYSLMARCAGIRIPDTFLLTGKKKGQAFFAIQRFDVDRNAVRLHTHTLAGLLGINFREAVPDYGTLLRVTGDLTRDHRHVTEAYRRMVFNYLGSNLDDHSKNITFTMDKKGGWALSPAYDIGYSTGENNLHAMAINGKRRNALQADFQRVAEDFDVKEWRDIIRQAVDSLREWPALAKKYGVPVKLAAAVWNRIKEHTGRITLQ